MYPTDWSGMIMICKPSKTLEILTLIMLRLLPVNIFNILLYSFRLDLYRDHDFSTYLTLCATEYLSSTYPDTNHPQYGQGPHPRLFSASWGYFSSCMNKLC